MVFLQQFLATQLIMQTSESGISAKSLRGRDSTRKQDASEKVRMLHPAEGCLVSFGESQDTAQSSSTKDVQNVFLD